MDFSREELIEYLKETIITIPCFHCVDGMLELVDVKFNDLVQINVYCSACKSKDKFEQNLCL